MKSWGEIIPRSGGASEPGLETGDLRHPDGDNRLIVNFELLPFHGPRAVILQLQQRHSPRVHELSILHASPTARLARYMAVSASRRISSGLL